MNSFDTQSSGSENARGPVLELAALLYDVTKVLGVSPSDVVSALRRKERQVGAGTDVDENDSPYVRVPLEIRFALTDFAFQIEQQSEQ